MKKTLVLVAALLGACATTPQPRPEDKVEIVWTQVDDPQKVCDEISGRKELFRTLGCSKWKGAGTEGGARICQIYAPPPRNEKDLQRFATLGHELMHCFDGNWHDRYGEMKPEFRESAAGASAARAPGRATAAD